MARKSDETHADPSVDPTPEIPAVTSTSESNSATTPVKMTPGAVAYHEPRKQRIPDPPSGKEMRVIRVITPEDVTVVINAEDYDPEIHTPFSDTDKKYGELEVTRKANRFKAIEALAELKRTVRGQ